MSAAITALSEVRVFRCQAAQVVSGTVRHPAPDTDNFSLEDPAGRRIENKLDLVSGFDLGAIPKPPSLELSDWILCFQP